MEYPFIATQPGVIALDRVLSLDEIELFDIWTECKQMVDV